MIRNHLTLLLGILFVILPEAQAGDIVVLKDFESAQEAKRILEYYTTVSRNCDTQACETMGPIRTYTLCGGAGAVADNKIIYPDCDNDPLQRWVTEVDNPVLESVSKPPFKQSPPSIPSLFLRISSSDLSSFSDTVIHYEDDEEKRAVLGWAPPDLVVDGEARVAALLKARDEGTPLRCDSIDCYVVLDAVGRLGETSRGIAICRVPKDSPSALSSACSRVGLFINGSLWLPVTLAKRKNLVSITNCCGDPLPVESFPCSPDSTSSAADVVESVLGSSPFDMSVTRFDTTVRGKTGLQESPFLKGWRMQIALSVQVVTLKNEGEEQVIGYIADANFVLSKGASGATREIHMASDAQKQIVYRGVATALKDMLGSRLCSAK